MIKVLRDSKICSRFNHNSIIVIILLCSIATTAQEKDVLQNIPRDNYFTLESATIKVQKKYPEAIPVLLKLPENVFCKENIVYDSSNGRPLHLDYLRPKEHGNLNPGVLMIHGGGWRSGNRSMEIPMAQQIASKGYVAVTVEYRLSPEAKYPAAVYDLKNAVKWMRKNWKELNLDTNKIAAYGCSSGGHLASFLGATNGNDKFETSIMPGSASSNINAVLNVDGPVDLTHPEESAQDSDPIKPSSVKRWIGYSFGEKPELWIEASPINYVDDKMPPIVFINSSLENYHVGRDYMVEKLRLLSVYCEINTIPNSPHNIWLFHPWFDQTLNHVINFLKKVF